MLRECYYMKKPECDLTDRESVAEYLMNGDLYDTSQGVLLIGDVMSEGDDFVLNGVMMCAFDPTQFREGDAALEDPVAWALSNVPAPGTGCDDRMVLIDVDTVLDNVSIHPEDFACANTGFIIGYCVPDNIKIV